MHQPLSVDSAAKAAFDAAPGSSPWDWKTFPKICGRQTGSFVWSHDQNDGPGSDYVALQDANTSAYKLVLGVHCHPFALGPGRLGLWFAESESLRLVCFDVDMLPDVPRPARFTKLGMRFHAGVEPVSWLVVPPNLPSNTVHRLDTPNCFNAVTELLMIAPYGRDQVPTIISLKPTLGELTTYPQSWFYEMFKGGWEFISKVTRHPERLSIIGSGPRIRPFELADDNRHLARWL